MPERAPWWLWPGRLVVAGVVLAGIGWLSNQPYGEPAGHAVLRMAWRMAGAQVRLCRQRSEEELSRLAPHMRLAESCRARTLPYRLEVRVDGQVRVSHPVQSVGAQGDRPLYVQEELMLAPGDHLVALEFRVAPELAGAPDGGIAVENPAEAEALERALAEAPAFRDEVRLAARPGRIILVEPAAQGSGFRIIGN